MGQLFVNNTPIEFVLAPDWDNYYDRLRIIAIKGKAAVEAGDEAKAERLREEWRATKAIIDAHQPCSRCYGSARTFKPFMHVYQGKCFRCAGTGLDPIKPNGERWDEGLVPTDVIKDPVVRQVVTTLETLGIFDDEYTRHHEAYAEERRAALLGIDLTQPEYGDPEILEDAIQAAHDRNFMAAWRQSQEMDNQAYAEESRAEFAEMRANGRFA